MNNNDLGDTLGAGGTPTDDIASGNPQQPEIPVETSAMGSPVAGQLGRKGFMDLLYGVITKPSEAFRYLVETKPVLLSLLLYVAIAWIGAIAGIPGTINTIKSLNEAGRSSAINPSLIITITIITVPIISAISLAILTGIYHIIAIILKGKGSYSGLISALGFASFPSIFSVPFALLPLVLGLTGSIIVALISSAFGIWVRVLDIFAVHENYQFSWGRAISTVLIPLIVATVLLIVVIVAILAFAISTINGLKAS